MKLNFNFFAELKERSANIPSVTMSLLFVFVPLIAMLYASVGFGGATGYLAVMSLFGVEPQVMASTALVLNVIVASISFFTYFRAGHLRRDLLLPFIITSIPAAFIGGSIQNFQIIFIRSCCMLC